MIRFSILKVVYQGRVLLPPDLDAYGLLRATHSHNPTLYSHIGVGHITEMVYTVKNVW